jgi:CRP/FNR family transcriptional regulator, nitrogen fixation regulation protein
MLSRSTNVEAPPVVTIHADFGAYEASFRRNQEIHGQGEAADRIYEVRRGAVRSYKTLTDGRRQICAFHLPGDIFGWESGLTYRFTSEAIEHTCVRVVRRRVLEYVAERDVRVTRDLLCMATRNLEHAETQMMVLGRTNALERVAAFLLEMDRRLSGTDVLVLPMSRRDIADYLGLTLETVSRGLSQLRASGALIFVEGQRQIALNDRKKLELFA